jgi:hypothetical protein
MQQLKRHIKQVGLQQFSRDVGVTYVAVSKWLRKGEVPPRRVADVARLTGIPHGQLNKMFEGVSQDQVGHAAPDS